MAVNDSTFRKKLSRVLFYLLMVVTCVLIAFPIYWLLNSSFQRESALFSYPPAFFPKLFSVEGFHKLFVDGRIWRWILNTAIVTISTVGLTVIFATLAGYSFSRFRYKGEKPYHWHY